MMPLFVFIGERHAIDGSAQKQRGSRKAASIGRAYSSAFPARQREFPGFAFNGS
jgi:hypothetical protein